MMMMIMRRTEASEDFGVALNLRLSMDWNWGQAKPAKATVATLKVFLVGFHWLWTVAPGSMVLQGIFDDPKLVADMKEAVATIKKARTLGSRCSSAWCALQQSSFSWKQLGIRLWSRLESCQWTAWTTPAAWKLQHKTPCDTLQLRPP